MSFLAVTDSRMSVSISVLTPLLDSSPHLLLSILDSHDPFAYPSRVSNQVHLDRFLSRLNTKVVAPLPHTSNVPRGAAGQGGDVLGAGEESSEQTRYRCEIWQVARKIALADQEGIVVGTYGRNWVSYLMGMTSSTTFPTLPLNLLKAHLDLITTLILVSPKYPSFHRETVLPIVVKLSQAISTSLKNAEVEGRWDRASILLRYLPNLLHFSPTPHRPLIPHLLPILQRTLVLLPIPQGNTSVISSAVFKSSVDLLATLHILTGKVAASTSWRNDLLSALDEAEWCFDEIVKDAFQYRFSGSRTNVDGGAARGAVTSALLPPDDGTVAKEHRLDALIRAMDGWFELAKGLMKFPTARPVAFPIGVVVNVVIRVLSITHESQMAEDLDAGHRIKLITALPRMWISASKLLATLVASVGDHLLPSLTKILETVIFLLETMPKSSHSSRLSLLRLLKFMLSRYTLDPSNAELSIRLIKLSVASLQPLVQDARVTSALQADSAAAGSTDKKSKKRRRDAVEDALVGGLEGRSIQVIKKEEANIAIGSLKLSKILQSHPALPHHVLAFSMKFLLSLAMTLQSTGLQVVVTQYPTFSEDLAKELEAVLESAMYLEGGSGSRRPWVGLIAANENIGLGDGMHRLIHPSQPPLARPLPPIASLAFYNAETDEEKDFRMEAGVAVETDEAVQQPPQKPDAQVPETTKITTETPVLSVTAASIVQTTPATTQAPADPATSSADVALNEPEPTVPSTTVPAAETIDEEMDVTEPAEGAVVSSSILVESFTEKPGPAAESSKGTTSAENPANPLSQQSDRPAVRLAEEDSDDEPIPEIVLDSDTDEDEEDDA